MAGEEPSDALRSLRIESSDRADFAALRKSARKTGVAMSSASPPPLSPSARATASAMALSADDAASDAAAAAAVEAEARKLAVPDRLKFELDDDAETTSEKKGDEDDAGAAFKAFEDWLLANGAKFPDLYLKRYGDSDVRGVHASRTIASYRCIIQIPLRCLITDEMGRETRMGRELFAQNYSLSTPNLIAVLLYMLETREDPDHFFQPYYRVLPAGYDSFPIFYDAQQLGWLRGSPLLEDIAERKRNMRADYDEICRLVPRFARFSYDEFLRVRTAVGSRNFGIVVHGQKRTAMVPYSDMLNHYRPRETSWTFEDARDAFTITSLTALQPHQQVMDSYGKKCNSKFLLHYGFAVMDNREEDGKCQNEMYLRLHLPPQDLDGLHEDRLALLGPTRASRGFRLSMNIEDKATAEALAFCRVAAASPAELAQLLSAAGATDADEDDHAAAGGNAGGKAGARRAARADAAREALTSYVSARNEMAALEMLARACKRQLERYPESYEDNVALLRSGSLKPFSVRMTTLIVVTGEQEILVFWMRAAEALADVLLGLDGDDATPLYQKLRALPRDSPTQADLARYASRVAYDLRLRTPSATSADVRAASEH